jgi:hypothetical protein
MSKASKESGELKPIPYDGKVEPYRKLPPLTEANRKPTPIPVREHVEKLEDVKIIS